MSVKHLHLYILTIAAIFGCASGGSGAPGTATVRRSASVLTAEEIASAHADITTAYDAVARLRPNWLAARGPAAYASVFVDGQQYGDLTSLRNISAYHVGNIRYYDVTQSTARFGTRGGSAGAIEVTTKTP